MTAIGQTRFYPHHRLVPGPDGEMVVTADHQVHPYADENNGSVESVVALTCETGEGTNFQK